MFDFGLTLYFGNRLFFAVEQGDHARARHVLAAGNLAMIGASLFGIIAVTSLYLVFGETVGGIDERSTLLWSMCALAVATGLRQSIATQFGLYRAHQQFFRQTMMSSSGDLMRVIFVLIAVAFGGGLLVVSVVYLAATLLFSVILPIWDSVRRFPDFGFNVAVADSAERRTAISTSFQYWVQSIVATLVTFAPLFVLGAMKASAFAIVQFTLMRTIANFVRAILQLFANVFGLEAARRIAINDDQGLTAVYRESSRLLAVQMAGVAGGLAALAQPLFGMWTGNPQLYDVHLFWLAICAPLVLPTLSMALQILVCANMPAPLVQGRIAQMLVTAAIFLALPVDNISVRMMIALAVGEIIGLGVPLTFALIKIVPESGFRLHADLLARSLVVGTLTYGAARLAQLMAGPGKIENFIAGLIAAGLAFVICTWFAGLNIQRRHAAAALMRSLLSR